MKNICVFLGSADGTDQSFASSAQCLGELIAKRGHRLIYGGTNIGLMNLLADSALNHKGLVTGVITNALLKKGIVHPKIHTLINTDTMVARKQEMINRADVFVVLPGGLGTIDELMDVWTLKKINPNDTRPIAIVNTDGIFDKFFEAMKELSIKGFITPDQLKLVTIYSNVQELMDALLPEPKHAKTSTEAVLASLVEHPHWTVQNITDLELSQRDTNDISNNENAESKINAEMEEEITIKFSAEKSINKLVIRPRFASA